MVPARSTFVLPAVTLAVLLALTGCGSATPSTGASDPGPAATSGPAPSGETAADLEYPMFFEDSMLDTWDGHRTQLADQHAAWLAECTVADADDPDGDCKAGLQELLVTVNTLKQDWFAFDNGDWDSGEYSGLEALRLTRDATLVASESGATWSGSCLYAGGSDECTAAAETFLADVDALDSAFAEWPR
jgi:hypothetical protein